MSEEEVVLVLPWIDDDCSCGNQLAFGECLSGLVRIVYRHHALSRTPIIDISYWN